MNLYHYTSEDGYKGIMLNKKIRLTLSTQSNDKKDTVYIYDLIKNNKDKLFETDNSQEKMVIDGILNSFGKFKSRVENNDFNDQLAKPFIICFTDKKDDKDMWESYTHNEGYCLGISCENLVKYAKSAKFNKEVYDNARSYHMLNVVYDEDSQINIVHDIIKEEYSKFLEDKNQDTCKELNPISFSYNFRFVIKGENGEEYIDETEPKLETIVIKQKFYDFLQAFYNQLLFVAPLIKNSFWKSENEVRWTFLRMLKDDCLQDIKKNEKGNYYFELNIDKSLIDEVIIGPLNKKSIEDIKEELSQAGYNVDKLSIKYSKGKEVLRAR